MSALNILHRKAFDYTLFSRDDTNPTNASWVYRYVYNGRALYSEPIYAATCVYYPAGGAFLYLILTPIWKNC